MNFAAIEPLEPRIAPASLTGRVLKYMDVDGDQVTVTFTKGTLGAANFTFDTAFGSTGQQQLQRIDLSGVTDVETSNITVAVKKAAGGDGVANIGEIIATGHDLGTVKTKGNLGKIVAGNNALPAPGIKSLTIGSYGILDGATQPAGSNQSSTITGNVPTFTVLGDFGGGALQIVGHVTTLKIGGSLVGTAVGSEGRLLIAGNLTTGTIGGSFLGGSGGTSGQMSIGGNVGTLLVRGSLMAGSSDVDQSSGQINISGSAKTLTILGDVRGPTGAGVQHSIFIAGPVGALTIGGNISAMTGRTVSIVLANDVDLPIVAVGKVLIKGTTQGLLLDVAQNFGDGGSATVSSVTINGSFLQSRISIGAGNGDDDIPGTGDDELNAASVLGKLVIKGLAFGTVGGMDYFGIHAGKVASAIINGRALPLAIGAQTLNVAPSGDVFVRDAV